MTLPDRMHGHVVYPETDGRPMAETDTHRALMMDLIYELSEFFRDDPATYVSGNLLLYYREGNPRKSVSPDVFVVKEIEKKERPVYKLWEEGKMPDVVMEITSKTTCHEDLGTKKSLYSLLGVKEYFIFDPFSEYLKPTLRGYRLSGDKFLPLQGRIISEILGLELVVEEDQLRLYETFSRKKLLTPAETARSKEEAERARETVERERDAAEQARDAAEQARDAAERARETVERERDGAEQARDAAEQKYEDERAARERAEDEIRQLRAALQGGST